jgi:hypothetical protein
MGSASSDNFKTAIGALQLGLGRKEKPKSIEREVGETDFQAIVSN